MKNYIFILLVLVFLPINSQSQLITTYTVPTYFSTQTIGAFSPNIVFVASTNEIYRSTNQGLEWQLVYGHRDSLISIRDNIICDNQLGFIVGEKDFVSLLLKTTNAGINWERITLPTTQTLYSIASEGNEIRITGNMRQIISSTDRGLTWTVSTALSNFFDPSTDILVKGEYTYTSLYRITKSQNLINWTEICPVSGGILGIGKNGNRLFGVGRDLNEPYFAQMRYSDNEGASWIDTVFPHPGLFYRIKFMTESIGFVCGYSTNFSGIILQSLDGGNSWTSIFNGLPNSRLRDISISENQAYFCGEYQVIRYEQNMTGIQEENFGFSNSYQLMQNYPNPFNPSTLLKYTIPKKSFVTLKIFDSMGREIQTVINGYKEAGNHEVTFTSNTLPSGVYFYTLYSGGYKETKKMILLK